MKFNGLFIYQSQYKGMVCIGYRSLGHIRIDYDGFIVLKPSGEFCRVTNFGKVDGVDLIEGVID